MSTETREQYNASVEQVLADGTDPWLQRPDGTVVALEPILRALPVGACGDCRHGVFAPTAHGPAGQGIERCDLCGTYDGDLDAAVALALIAGPDVTVWVETDTDD